MITVDICGETVPFSKIITDGTSASFYADSQQRYFLKVPNSRTEFINEVESLRRLQKYGHHFPQLFLVGTNFFVLEFIHGTTLLGDYRPSNSISQMNHIIDCLEKEGLYHSDIHPRQVIVGNDGIIRLIDFGRTLHKANSHQRAKYLELVTTAPSVLASRYSRFMPNRRGF